MAAPLPERAVLAPFGPVALDALADIVASAQRGDPVAPVTIAVPSATAGVSIRRALVHRGSAIGAGLLNVRLASVPQLIERLAGPQLAAHARPFRPHALEAEAIRAALASMPPPLGSVNPTVATVRAVAATLADLGDATAAELEHLTRQGPVPAAAVALHRTVAAATVSWADRAALIEAAVAAVDGDDPVCGEVGHVAVYVPRRLGAGECRVLEALARRQRLSLVLGTTGDATVDAQALDLAARFENVLGPARRVEGPTAVLRADTTRVVRAPDPDEEVRVAVRLVVEHLRHGGVPERVAIGFRVAEPYALLVPEQLAAAGVAHHGPPTSTLAQSVAGRALLGAFALPDGDFRRADVVAWLRSAPIVEPATGNRAPVERWNADACDAGVASGIVQWEQRLLQAEALDSEHLERRRSWGELTEESEARAAERAARRQRLRAFMARLAVDLDPTGRRGWAALAEWATTLLDSYLGDGTGFEGWPEAERAAYDGVRSAIDRLAALESVALDGALQIPVPDLAAFRSALEHALDRPVRSTGTFGHGVVVGRLVEIIGADLDLVVVLGMVEGAYPPRPSDDALLPDRVRATVGTIAPRGFSRNEERRDHLAALATARERVLCFPRADSRAQRARQPSRWLVEACATLSARPLSTVEVAGGPVLATEPWFVDVESFEWWLATGGPPASPHDLDTGALLTARRAQLALEREAVVAAEPALGRGLAAVTSRRDGRFDEWTGKVRPRPEFVSSLERPLSATALEHWARCSFRYFLSHVLGVVRRDDPADLDEISALDLGSLVHEILERFVAEGLGRAPSEPWSDHDHQRLLAIAREVAGDWEASGRTGRPLLWRLRWERLQGHLGRILVSDDEHRAIRGVTPAAVELSFGLPDSEHPAVEVPIDADRSVAFRGRIDRVDRSPDGRRLVVLDYKTGKSQGFDVGDDVTERGTRLQLPVYAHAARRTLGRDVADIDVEARYWFVGERGEGMPGRTITADDDRRFREVLALIVDGIAAGHFPARPGTEVRWPERHTWENCNWCPYDAVCPADRSDLWERVRDAPELAAYVELAEGEPAAGDEEPGG